MCVRVFVCVCAGYSTVLQSMFSLPAPGSTSGDESFYNLSVLFGSFSHSFNKAFVRHNERPCTTDNRVLKFSLKKCILCGYVNIHRVLSCRYNLYKAA